MRYIGNKAKLLETLDKFLSSKGLAKKGMVFCDLFSGTCTVITLKTGIQLLQMILYICHM